MRTTAADRPPAGTLEAAEAVLVERYPHLVRLAYLLLPPALGRHRRVLAAHATVQRALPRGTRAVRRALAAREVPHPDPLYALLRLRVVRGALARQRAGRPGRALPPVLPAVLGLRLFPGADGPDALALDQALAGLDAGARAAFVLRRLEGLTDTGLRRLLTDAGAADPEAAMRTARDVPAEEAQLRLLSSEFDAHAVQLRATDLIRRRTRRRGAPVAALVLAVLLGGTAHLAGGEDTPPQAAPRGGPGAPSAERLVRAPAEAWADTGRVDFTAWPARGGRRDDAALLRRAVAAWSGAGEADVRTVPGTPAGPPGAAPQLLWAGDVAGEAVVVLLDGVRVARWGEPSGGGKGSLLLARADGSDVTTGAALALHRGADGVRYLTAPWVAEAAVRDLRAPEGPAEPLRRGPDGVTEPVPAPPSEGCSRWPALELRSSARIVEDHSFLLADLQDPVPVHLTYTPPPHGRVPAARPAEVAGEEALRAWAGSACELGALRGKGVRAVGTWEFARQDLPGDGDDGEASWVCTRADTWEGPGSVTVRLRQRPEDHGELAARAEDTAACGRFGQHVLAGLRWESPGGRWYQLAAGSREVTRIEASGAAEGFSATATLAVPTGEDAPEAGLTARLSTGGTLRALR